MFAGSSRVALESPIDNGIAIVIDVSAVDLFRCESSRRLLLCTSVILQIIARQDGLNAEKAAYGTRP